MKTIASIFFVILTFNLWANDKEHFQVIVFDPDVKGKAFVKKGFKVQHPTGYQRSQMSVEKRDYLLHKHKLESETKDFDHFQKDILIDTVKHFSPKTWKERYKRIPASKLKALKEDL